MPLQMSMVLFRDTPAFAVQEIQTFLASHWPELGPVSDIVEDDMTLSMSLPTADVAIGMMPIPVPASDLDEPCATSILWPDARTIVPGHLSHAIVTVHGELAPVALSTLLTQVTAALMASTESALGVFWTNATLLVPKDLFIDFAVEVLPAEPPLPIWVDYRVGWNEDRTTSAGFTKGMAALGHMELEARAANESPAELRKRFEAVTGYLLENGPVIDDRDTVGENAHEKIRVVYGDSAYGGKQQVMQLVYATEAKKMRRWKLW